MKLTDIPSLKLQQSQFIADKVKVEDACKKLGLENYTINNDLTVDVDGNVTFPIYKLSTFPVKFNKVSGKFTCNNSDSLISLEGAPKIVQGFFSCYNCPKLTSLEHCPQYIGSHFNIAKCDGIRSLHNIHKLIKSMNGVFRCEQINSHMLGLCLIKDLQTISHPVVGDIINKHLKDIIMCQDALIDAGFAEYAKL